jgi:uncharacterized protein YbjT (DUF2867 family)
MRVLVTGGTGYVGSHTVATLVKHGQKFAYWSGIPGGSPPP